MTQQNKKEKIKKTGKLDILRAVIPHECARNENGWGNVKIV